MGPAGTTLIIVESEEIFRKADKFLQCYIDCISIKIKEYANCSLLFGVSTLTMQWLSD
jgi:hypothetical protein